MRRAECGEFYLSALDEQSWGESLGGFVLPALIGNVLGGTGLVAALNHAQAVTGLRTRRVEASA